jgi:hypothetical protein
MIGAKSRSVHFIIFGFIFFLFSMQSINNPIYTITQNQNEQKINIDLPQPSVVMPSYETAWGKNITNSESGSGPGEFDYPNGICANATGYIFVADWDNNRIQRFYPNNTYDGEWYMQDPVKVISDFSTGYIIVIGNDNNWSKYYPNGTFIQEIRYNGGSGDGEFYGLRDMALNATHAIIVDYQNHRVQIMNKTTGSYISQFGSYGDFVDGKFSGPCAIAINSSGYMYIGERGHGINNNNSFHLYSPNGEFVKRIIVDKSVEAIGIDNAGNVYLNNKTYDQNLNFLYSYALEWGPSPGAVWGVSGIAIANGYIYISEISNNRVSLFRLPSGPTFTVEDLIYRSVATSSNITSEIWKFNNSQEITFAPISYFVANVSKYSLSDGLWYPHPNSNKMGITVAVFAESYGRDGSSEKREWGNRKYLYLPNLKWKYYRTGELIASAMQLTIDPKFDQVQNGSNWVNFTSSNPQYAGYFMYARVNASGYLEEFHHMEKQEQLHLILEPNIAGFLASMGVTYKADQSPVYTKSTTQPKDNQPASSSRSASNSDALPVFPWDAQEGATLYRYTPTETVNVVETYENDRLEVVMDETLIISEPKIEIKSTQQRATVDYFDEDTNTWKPADNGKGNNTFIISSCNKETVLPLIMGKDLKVPLVLPENAKLPSENDIKRVFGNDTIVRINGTALYVEYSHDGIVFYLDVEYNADGQLTKMTSRLPTTSGTKEAGIVTMTKAEADAYIESITTDDKEDKGIPGYPTTSLFLISSLGVGFVILKIKKQYLSKE